MILAALAIAWLLGIAAVAFTGQGFAAALAAAGLFAAVLFASQPRPATLALLAVAAPLIFAAAWRYQATEPVEPPNAISRLSSSQELRFRAIVTEAPEDRLTSRIYRLSVREVLVDGRWRDSVGGVLMRTSSSTGFEYGDVLEVAGRLEAPPEIAEFDYAEHLARQGISNVIAYPETRLLARDQGNALTATLINLRGDLTGAIDRALPEPESSLAGGILFGARSGLPPDLKNDMDATGTSHLVAVSGQNIAMLAGFLIAALAWLVGRRPASWIALGAILGYAALVGPEPSVVRATIMGSVYIASIALGRQNTGWIALTLAAGIMTAVEPRIVHEVSFQLSFAAVLGLVVLANPLQTWMEAVTWRSSAVTSFPLTRPLLAMTAMSLSSIAFTLPITAVSFQQVSLAAPFANLFIAPAFVVIAITSTLVAAAGLVSPDAADLFAAAAWPPAAYMVAAVHLFADIPGASLRAGGIGTEHAIAWYAALAAATLWLTRRGSSDLPPLLPAAPLRRPRLAVPATAAVLILSSALVWLSSGSAADNRLSVTFLDVGQGEAILIESASGNRVLIDGGPSGEAITAALGRSLPFYDRRIDLIVVTHPQTDHIGGLPAVLERYEVNAIIQSSAVGESLAYESWAEAIARSGATAIEARRGHEIDLGSGAEITILGPLSGATSGTGETNDSSTVLLLSYGSTRILLTGDISGNAEGALVASGTQLQADVLKVAHHGSVTSTSRPFLDRVRPGVAVISAGRDNRFGHPDPETLARLDQAEVFRTDQDGDVTVLTDGQNVWVKTSR